MSMHSGAARPVHRLAAALAAALVAPSALAAPSPADEPTRLDTVQVTATRVETPIDEALASVTVIGRAEIVASQAPDLIDLLGRQAGIDVARTGGPGGGSALFLRGGNSNHVLVLIDGIRVGSAGQGVFDFAHLPLEQIERIEIVRGPRAALWGSDAIGGVVHVFTRDPSGPSARVSAGSDGLVGASAGTGFGDVGRGLGVTAGIERLHGFSATTPDAFSYDPDDDGYRNRSLSVRGTTAVGTQRLAFAAIGTHGDVEFDRGDTDARNVSGGVTLGGALGSAWNHQLTVGHAREDLDSRGDYPNAFRSRRTSLDWVHDIAVGDDARLLAGVNLQRESGRSSDGFSGLLFDETRSSRAVFAGWGGRFGAHVFDASLRRDESDQFGGATTGNVAWGWDASDAVRLRLSWGEGFRAPNFNELYYPDQGFGFAGNPALRPEASATWEGGLAWRVAEGHRLGLSVYRTRVRDLIAFAAPGTNDAINVQRARLEGVELDYRFDRGGWTGGGNATWQDAVDEATGRPLLRRAKRKAHADLGYRFAGGLELGVDADYVSARADYGADLASFALLHLRAAWTLSPAWRLEARVENAGDRDYTLVHGYATPGRGGVVSLVWTGR